MDELLKLYNLIGEFVADRNSTSTDTVYNYDYTGAGSNYVYNEATETFTRDVGNGTYSIVESTVNTAVASDDVDAMVRTTEILPYDNFVNRTATLKMYLKRSITRSLDYEGVEVFTNVYTYEDNANVLDKDPEVLTAYEDPRDVNQADDTYSRLNGTRNFIAPEVPLPSNLTKSISIELTMKNEGILHDLTLVRSGRNEVGGD